MHFRFSVSHTKKQQLQVKLFEYFISPNIKKYTFKLQKV